MELSPLSLRFGSVHEDRRIKAPSIFLFRLLHGYLRLQMPQNLVSSILLTLTRVFAVSVRGNRTDCCLRSFFWKLIYSNAWFWRNSAVLSSFNGDGAALSLPVLRVDLSEFSYLGMGLVCLGFNMNIYSRPSGIVVFVYRKQPKKFLEN